MVEAECAGYSDELSASVAGRIATFDLRWQRSQTVHPRGSFSPRAQAFYEGVLGLEPIYSDNRLSAYAVARHDVLLVFRKGTTGQTVVLPNGGTIPGHGGDGHLHVAFAIGKDELERWETHLASRGVAIEGRTVAGCVAFASRSEATLAAGRERLLAGWNASRTG